MAEPHFDKLTINDAQAMAELESLCFATAWSAEQCEGMFGNRFFSAIGLKQEERLLGYISFFTLPDEFEIVNLAVEPYSRRKGYGRRILGLVLKIAIKMGIQRVILYVRESNYGAISLYEKSGFYRIGARPGYYPDNGENALVYKCDL